MTSRALLAAQRNGQHLIVGLDLTVGRHVITMLKMGDGQCDECQMVSAELKSLLSNPVRLSAIVRMCTAPALGRDWSC